MTAPPLPLEAYGSSDAGKFLAGLNLPGIIANFRSMTEQRNNDQARQIGLQLALRKQYMDETAMGYHGGVKPPSVAGGGDPSSGAQQAPDGTSAQYGNQTQAGPGAATQIRSAPQVPMQPTPTSGGAPSFIEPSVTQQEPNGLGARIGRFLGGSSGMSITMPSLGPRNGYSQAESDEMLRQEIQQHQSDVDYERQLNVLGINHDFEHREDVFREGEDNKRAAMTASRDDARSNASEQNATTRALLGAFAATREQALGRVTTAREQLKSLQGQKDMFGNPAASPADLEAANKEFTAARDQYNNNDHLLKAVVTKLRPDLASSLDNDTPDLSPPNAPASGGVSNLGALAEFNQANQMAAQAKARGHSDAEIRPALQKKIQEIAKKYNLLSQP
jgi:hypothetical protein